MRFGVCQQLLLLLQKVYTPDEQDRCVGFAQLDGEFVCINKKQNDDESTTSALSSDRDSPGETAAVR